MSTDLEVEAARLEHVQQQRDHAEYVLTRPDGYNLRDSELIFRAIFAAKRAWSHALYALN